MRRAAGEPGSLGRGRVRRLEHPHAEPDDSAGPGRHRPVRQDPTAIGASGPRRAFEPLAGVMQPGHHGSDGAAQHLGDLAVREALDVTQHDNRSRLGRQGIEGASWMRSRCSLRAACSSGPPPGSAVVRAHSSSLNALGAERARLGPALAMSVGRDIHRDTEQPGVERRLAAERGQRVKRSYERLLGHVPRLLAVVQDLVGQAPHPLTVLLDERLEGPASPAMHCWMSARSSISGGSGAPAVPVEPGGVAGPITAGAGRGPRAPYPTASWTGEGPAFTASAARGGGEGRRRPRGPGQKGVHAQEVTAGPEPGYLADRGGGHHRAVGGTPPVRGCWRDAPRPPGPAPTPPRLGARSSSASAHPGLSTIPWNPSRAADWIQSTSSPLVIGLAASRADPAALRVRCTARFTSASDTRPYTAGSRVPRRLRLGPWRTRMADAAGGRRAIGGREYTAAATAPNSVPARRTRLRPGRRARDRAAGGRATRSTRPRGRGGRARGPPP